MRFFIAGLLLCAAQLSAAEKAAPSGVASNESAAISAKLLDAAEVRQAVGSDLKSPFVVMEVTITPNPAKPVDIRLDDFLLRDSSSLEHTGPVVAAMVLDSGGIVLHQQKQEVIGIETVGGGLSEPTKNSGAQGTNYD